MFETSLLFNNLDQGRSKSNPDTSWTVLKRWLVPCLLLGGILSVAWGTWLHLAPDKIGAPIHDLTLELDSTPDESILYIDVSGAVKQPGVYAISDGDRVADALEVAGGLAEDADATYLHSTLNLSARLKDEQKIYIPFEQERQGDLAQLGGFTNVSSSLSDELVSINSASLSELDTLPKIGTVTAQKIIDGRPYNSIEELVSRKIIGNAVFTEIKSLVQM